MAIVVVQVGQCGNQLGDEFFTQLYTFSKGNRQLPSPFFTRDGMARCVLVDSEPKVVRGVAARNRHFIRGENVVEGQSGRGNNWGLGYYGVRDPHPHPADGIAAASAHPFIACRKDQRVADGDFLTRALRAIHLEAWRTADSASFEAILLLHSLAGGTGSGFAARLAEKIRFHFIEPSEAASASSDEREEDDARRRDGLEGMLVGKRRARFLLSLAVAPQLAGELATQSLNATLSLHVLHGCVDGIILLRNADVMVSGEVGKKGEQGRAPTSSAPTILPPCATFKEANEVLVAMVLPLFLYGETPGGVEGLLRQVLPQRMGEGEGWGGAPRARGSRILSLLPTPQGSYEAWRGCARRGRFYAIHGGKTGLPGCGPTIPWEVISSAREKAAGSPRGHRLERPRREREKTNEQTNEKENANEGGGGGGGVRSTSRWRMGGDPRRPRISPARKGRRALVEGDAVGNDASSSPLAESDPADSPFVEVPVSIPKDLLSYYVGLKRSPVAKLARSLEGVAVLNQTRELNAMVLFPLLSSAAFKVKVGAFLHMYEAAGVSAQRIEKAYRELAEILSESEEC
ncbi:unnamed protein product [Phytomonas sp. EM1]|nr:unnamed protein product [Phytomonas sp. EM1]|eukprot:CCW59819.1 unnamed protein product [Phytomonas sp. isolate EM1]